MLPFSETRALLYVAVTSMTPRAVGMALFSIARRSSLEKKLLFTLRPYTNRNDEQEMVHVYRPLCTKVWQPQWRPEWQPHIAISCQTCTIPISLFMKI